MAPASGNAAELFFHINGSTTTLFSLVKDNGATPVALVKDQVGQLTFANATTPANNTYSGGTYVQGAGTLTTGGTANQTYLGTGPVFVNNALLNQAARGATSSTGGYTAVNNAEIVLTASSTGAGSVADYTATGDRYNIAGGSSIYANSPGAGTGFNALTRVATPGALAAGGNIFLAPDAIIQYNMTNAAGQGTGALAPNNLGTAADLYFAPGNNPGTAAGVTIGAGTPYKGLSTDRSNRSFVQGTITANSDFFLQGLAVNGGFVTLTLGGGPITIANAAGRPINADVIGNVNLGQAAPSYPNTLTFIGTPGSTITTNAVANALGADTTVAANNASVVLQAGSLLNINPTLNTLNGTVTFEAGSRFLGDDTSTTTSISGIGSLNFQKGGIFDLQQSAALSGSAALNWQTGSILRLQNSNPLGVSTRVGPGVVYEVFNGDPALTSQAAPENVTVNGGGFTNDSNGRNLQAGNGRIVIPAGGTAFAAATTNSTLGIQEDFDLGTGATLNIGSAEAIAGNPKFGTVNLQGGSRGDATNTFNVSAGATLGVAGVGAIPDLSTVNIGAGGFLSLNANDLIETIGGLTGTGSVVTAQTGGTPSPVLRVGGGNASSSFAGAFSNVAGASPTLIKIGTGTLTLTGVSNAATRYLQADQGTILLRDGGSAQFVQYAANRTGTLTLDNQIGTPLTGRLGTGKNLYVSGGTFNLNGANVAATPIL